MGKVTRIVYLSLPFALSGLSLICLLVVFLGGNDNAGQQLYHYKIDTSQFKAKVAAGVYMVPGSKIADNLLYALTEEAKSNTLPDFFNIYTWKFCSGNKGVINYCSPAKAEFYFDPMQDFALNNTLSERYTPQRLSSPLNVFKKGTQWLFIAYVIAFSTTAASIIVGIFAIFSRLGSVLTTLVASVSPYNLLRPSIVSNCFNFSSARFLPSFPLSLIPSSSPLLFVVGPLLSNLTWWNSTWDPRLWLSIGLPLFFPSLQPFSGAFPRAAVLLALGAE